MVNKQYSTKYHFIFRFLLKIISLPFILKGGKIGKKSYISYGYDLFNIRLKGILIKDEVKIGRGAWIGIVGNNGQIIIGDNTNIGRNFTASSKKMISIGKNCLISYRVSIFDHDHVVNNPNVSPIKSGLSPSQPVIINDNCFIGANSFILKGVQLGQHCVVGANSVVTKSFPKNSIIAGNPAKLIKKIKSK